MHCILVHLFKGKAVPQVSILNSEVWNRKFRNLGFEIPKLWIPKTAQDCCEKVNGTLDWGIPKILITSWIPKSEQFQKPLLPNKWLLIGSHSHLCCVILHAHCPCQCKGMWNSTAISKPNFSVLNRMQLPQRIAENPELTRPLYLQRSVHSGTVCLSFLSSLFCPIQVTTAFQVTMCAWLMGHGDDWVLWESHLLL